MKEKTEPRFHLKGFMCLQHSPSHAWYSVNWKCFDESSHTPSMRWQRLSISLLFLLLFGLSEIQLLFYCNSNPRPSYICGQFSLLQHADNAFGWVCVRFCLVSVYQSRISFTHEFYIMINIVNKTKNILASKKKLLYWNGYNDIGGQSASWFLVIPDPSVCARWRI